MENPPPGNSSPAGASFRQPQQGPRGSGNVTRILPMSNNAKIQNPTRPQIQFQAAGAAATSGAGTTQGSPAATVTATNGFFTMMNAEGKLIKVVPKTYLKNLNPSSSPQPVRFVGVSQLGQAQPRKVFSPAQGQGMPFRQIPGTVTPIRVANFAQGQNNVRRSTPPGGVKRPLQNVQPQGQGGIPAATVTAAVTGTASPSPKEAQGVPVTASSPTKKSVRHMRLRCRTRPLHLQSTYFENNVILEKDADVLFVCGDGGKVRGHKVILATMSTYFTDIFKDQPIGEVSVVSVPDVSSDVMKLILLLSYKAKVNLNADQLESIKEDLVLFGLNFDLLCVDELEGQEEEIDVAPGKVWEPVRIRRLVELPKRRIVPSFTPEQRQSLMAAKQAEKRRIDDGQEDEEMETAVGDLTTESDALGMEEDTPRKRPRVESAEELVCSLEECGMKFSKEEVWKWHCDRHYEKHMYKCFVCDQLKVTDQAIWRHEREEHNVMELDWENIVAAITSTGVSNCASPVKLPASNSSPKKMPNFRSTIPLQPELKRPADLKTYSRPFPQANQLFKIGEGSDIGDIDSKKMRQLHWIYVCARCDNCADSAVKSHQHYLKCYAEGETNFEDTVTKYRQGFYGKSACPLCPRKYVSNGGWVIHVGHIHTEYKSLFSHTGTVDDKIKCSKCFRKYSSPEDFHNHLKRQNGLAECVLPRIEENQGPATPQKEKEKEPLPQTQARKSAPASLAVEKKNSTPPLTAAAMQAGLTLGLRSTRRAKLASRQFMDKVLKESAEEEVGGDEVDAPKAKEEEEVFPPSDCPLCGASDITNLCRHLASEHKEKKFSVIQLCEDLLRCTRCTITFAICDLLSHPNPCTNDVEDEKPKKEKKEKVVKEPLPELEIPEGVGSSPVNKMELSLEDLMNHEVLFAAMQCPVCGKKAQKMGEVSNCLRSHGITRCSLCFNTYASRDEYERHMKACHFVGNKPKCLFCSPTRTFINVGQAVSHLNTIHWVEFYAEMKRRRTAAKKRSTGSGSRDSREEPEPENENGNGGESVQVEVEQEEVEMTEAEGKNDFSENVMSIPHSEIERKRGETETDGQEQKEELGTEELFEEAVPEDNGNGDEN